MYFNRFHIPTIGDPDKIRTLAEEMAKRRTQINKVKEEPIIEENPLEDISKDDDNFFKKHKSQIFVNRNKKKMLNNFSLNRVSDKNVITEQNKNGNRRQSSSLTNSGKIKRRRMGFKHMAHHFSIQSHKSNNNEAKETEENLESKNNSIYKDVKDEDIEKNNEDLYEDNENYIELDNEEENENENENEIDNEIENDLDEIYEVKYINPEQMKSIYQKTDSNDNINIINNKMKIIHKSNDKGRKFYDREMKLLNIKNKNIEKKRKDLDKKRENLIQRLDTSIVKARITNDYIMKNKDYIPINLIGVEKHRHKLRRIEMHEEKKKLKKMEEEKKEIDEVENFRKMNKKIYNQRNWEKFVDFEYFWLNKKLIKFEELRDKINNGINHQPKIDPNSRKIYEKLNKQNYGDNYYNNYNDNIFNKLYNQQKKYDNKLRMKREESMPSFKPLINKPNKSNKSQKFNKCLNNIDYAYRDKNSLIKTIKNNRSRNLSSLILFPKYNNYSGKSIQKIQNNLNNKKKLKLTESTLYNSSIGPKVTTATTKNINVKKKRNKNNSFDNYIKFNNPKNKSKIKEKNLNDQNSENNEYDKSEDNSNNFNVFEKGKKNNKSKDNYDFINKNEIKNKNKMKNMNKIKEQREKEKEKENNEINSIDINNEHKQELLNELKNVSQKNNDKNVPEQEKLLYNLNIRDNTSNTLRQNVILTSKKYSDFFKLKK